MAENTATKDLLKEITDGIEQGVQELFTSEKYTEYLRTMSRFHHYSLNNTLLIAMQKPNATIVAGFNKWHDQFDRNVLKGEKSIKIIAPTPFKIKKEIEKLDPITKAPLLDTNGQVITEEVEVKIPLYKVVSVFDVSQTDGKPLPKLASTLTGDVKQYDIFMEALRRSSPVPINFESINDGSDGYFSLNDQRIAIREGMSEIQTVSAAVHEITHAKLHNHELELSVVVAVSTTKEPPKPKDRRTEEVEAESVSYAVCAYYGIATGENSFGYIASWSKDKELPELRASLETINKTSSSLITDIDRNFTEIVKERGIDLSAPVQATDKNIEEMNVLEMIGHFMSQGMTEEQANDLANTEWQVRKKGQEVLTHKRPIPEAITNGTWRYYIIPDLKTWATNAAEQMKIEYFNTFEAVKTRFDELRLQPYNGETGDLNQHGEPYARLTLGIDRVDGVSATDILHVRDGKNYLVDDFTRMEKMRDNPAVLGMLSLVAGEIGFERVKGYERAEDGSYVAAPDMTFKQWNNPYFEVPKTGNINIPGDGDHIISLGVEEAPSDRAPDNGYMPDQSMSIEAMNAYGYTDSDMLPLSKSRALELFESDMPVYLLHDDNGAGRVFEQTDIEMHTGIFGVNREDWETGQKFLPVVDVKRTAQEQLESNFLNSTMASFAIYQLNRGDDIRDYLFEPMERLQAAGLAVERGNYYELAYTDTLKANNSTTATLNGIYEKFNLDRPADFKGHSLSVSDIVALNVRGKVSCHYVDSWGFVELPGFLSGKNPLRTLEDMIEQNDNQLDGIINNTPASTVTELGTRVKAGQSISLLDLANAVKEEKRKERPSVLEQMKSAAMKQEPKLTAPIKSVERER